MIATLIEVEKRIHELNKTVEITRCSNADVPIETVMNIGAFSLEEVMKIEPDFMNPDEEHIHDQTVRFCALLTYCFGTVLYHFVLFLYRYIPFCVLMMMHLIDHERWYHRGR